MIDRYPGQVVPARRGDGSTGRSPSAPEAIPEAVQEWVRSNVQGPTSVAYAACAAVMRTLEDGFDMEQAQRAGSVAARAWTPPPGASRRKVTIRDLHWLTEWKKIPSSAVSQGLAIQAAVLRSLELGQDMKSAIAAGRSAAQGWAPKKSSRPATGKLLQLFFSTIAAFRLVGRKLTARRAT